jgi:hypothetical protein
LAFGENFRRKVKLGRLRHSNDEDGSLQTLGLESGSNKNIHIYDQAESNHKR